MNTRVHTDASSFERIVHFAPAFDKRNPDPKKNYGIHGVELRMVLKGPLGATQFALFTNWQLPHVTEETMARCLGRPDRIGLKVSFLAIPADLGYHWLAPQYEGQSARDCEYTASGRCYYDRNVLNAERIYETLLREGSDGVWRELEAYYREIANESVTDEKGAS